MMKLDFLPSEKQESSKWSGGSTTQLFIFPPEASVAEKNFIFRISTAKVEAEESEFTTYPGYKRILMVLEGTLDIHHAGHHSKKLGAFDTDEFLGNWKTNAIGKVRDFNIIYAEDKQASLDKKEMSAGEIHLLSFADSNFTCVYVVSGAVEIEGAVMKAGDFLKAENALIENVIRIKATEDALLLCCKLKL